LSSITNESAGLQQRVRSYLDANCAQCHQPGGTGPTFDARYDTPFTNQNVLYGVLAKGNLGYDNAYVVVPKDLLRSVLYDRVDSTNSTIKMPPLARNLIDTNSVAVMAAWINSLPGVPAEEPPTINPEGGTFFGSVAVSLQPADMSAAIYYTLDGSLPTTNSALYTGPFTLASDATVNASAFENGFINSVTVTGQFFVLTNLVFTSPAILNDGALQIQFLGRTGQTYILQATTNFEDWVSISTNTPTNSPFRWIDPDITNFPNRFYRVFESN
jgi:hypothetical protein